MGAIMSPFQAVLSNITRRKRLHRGCQIVNERLGHRAEHHDFKGICAGLGDGRHHVHQIGFRRVAAFEL